jgi:NTE family protein
MKSQRSTQSQPTAPQAAHAPLPGQVVLVLQGGGALGAYQVGVYQAMHEAGIEPDWVIGTSIGAINAALIAGNRPEQRLEKLHAFWDRVEQRASVPAAFAPFVAPFSGSNMFANVSTVTRGIEGFFKPSPHTWRGSHAMVGVEQAAYYDTAPLGGTLRNLVDFDYINEKHTRLTVGAVNVRTGAMRYFDNRHDHFAPQHIMASGALPPAFGAVRIDGEAYWDGGIYSNTPIEAVLDDNPRRDSVIFAVNVWQPSGPEPESVWQVMGRQKDIQYASRADSHIERQKQIHRLRHVIRQLTQELPAKSQASDHFKELASWGCGTTMHVLRLLAPKLEGEDHTKDIDFTPAGVRARWQAGYAQTLRMIERAPWQAAVDPIEGVIVHQV